MFVITTMIASFVFANIFSHPTFHEHELVPQVIHKCVHDTLAPQARRTADGYEWRTAKVRFRDERFNEFYGIDLDSSERERPFSKYRERRSITQPICLVDGYENIRIHIETQFEGLSEDKVNYLETSILPNARAKISSLLSVIPVADGWSIPRNIVYEDDPVDCGTASIPVTDLTPKEISNGTWVGKNMTNADVVIYFTASDQDNCESGSTLAFAQQCIRVQDTGRPLVGYTNFCPEQIDSSADYFQQINDVAVTIHEIFHALGFSQDSFDEFRQPDGTLWGLENVIDTNTERDHYVTKIITPNAIKVARDHFSCDELDGVEIENGGGGGTAGSHPEMRIFQTDFMTGVLNANAVFSHITLAVMQDSGWYMANFQNADYLLWGRHRGCDFAQKNCLGSLGMTVVPPNTFCTENLEQRCTNDRRSIGICSISEYGNDLESYYQYFDQANYGGAQEVNDYCPIYNQFTIAGTDPIRTSNCKNPNNMEDDVDLQWYGEEYGVNSACFENNLRNTFLLANPLFDDIVGKCYRYSCSGTDSVTIFLAGGFAGIDTQVVCHKDDAGVKKEGGGPWVGELICPEIESICWEDDSNQWYINNDTCPNSCSGHGNCVPKCTCECDSGYEGDDCASPICFDESDYSDPNNVCSGHGTCESPDDCDCDAGFSGDDCSNTTCNSIGNQDIDVCDGHGTCIDLDVCECESEEFVGQFCQGTTVGCTGGMAKTDGACENVCYGYLASEDGLVCNGGVCDNVDDCDCDAVPLGGDECDSDICFGFFDNCGGHGTCISRDIAANDTCECDEGYFGPQCDDFACYGVEHNNTLNPGTVCGGHGLCEGHNDCKCTNGWYGVNCNYSTCYGIIGDNETHVCGGHGECVEEDECVCETSSYKLPDCTTWDCWGKSNQDSSVCSGSAKGTCVAPNECVCNGRYGGFECDVLSCYPLRCMEGCDYLTGECNWSTSTFNVSSFLLGSIILVFYFFTM